MHFTKFLSSVLLAVTAAASPLASGKVSLSRRQATSDGQAGAYIVAQEGIVFTSVRGTVAMPDLSNAIGDQQVSYWIGLDGIDAGANLNQIVIQAGFDAIKQQDGTVIYRAFYEWFPNPAIFISTDDFSASAGDIVSITLATSQSGTTAGAAFVNQNTLQSINVEFPSPDEESDARGANAQWVIERAPGTTLANFGEIKFTESAAAEANGVSHGLSGGTTINLVENGNTLATGAINGDSEVDITYTGP